MSLARMVAWINQRHGWRALFWGVFLVGTSLLLDFLPLFDVLGYDFSFALGLVAALAGVDLGHGTVQVAREQARLDSPARLWARATATLLTLLALSLALSLANALRVRNCNLTAGLAFFALLPVTSGLFGAGVGVSVAVLVPGRRLGRALAFAVPAVSLLWSLLRLYRDPAVFAFDPFAGYFPGPIYDEAMRPPLRLVWYRLANLTWLATGIALANWLARGKVGHTRPTLRPPRTLLVPWQRPLLVAVLGAASLLGFRAESALGVHVTHHDVAKVLSRETRSQHFVLRTDPTVESDGDAALASEDLEFRYFQLARILGVEPTGTITVYRFPSATVKKDVVGAATTLYAKPWTREIFVQTDRFPAQRIRHEMAHVFASAFGDRWFGVALSWRFAGPIPIPHLASGLVEGLAEAADFDNPDGRATTHEEAAAMLALGQAPDLKRALGAGFTFESGPRAYTIAGSFCRFLLDRFGAEKLRALYRSAGDFAHVYGRGLDDLEKTWREFLTSRPVDPRTKDQAEESFRRPAIFKKVCAREVAAKVQDARARMGTAPVDAVDLLTSACADDPNEPVFQLDLAEAWVAAGNPPRALALLAQAATAGLTRPLRGRAASIEAGIHFRAGEIEKARASVEEALRAATDDGDERTAKAKMRALRDPQSAATLGRVLFGDEHGRPLDPGLTVYLLGEFARENPGEALGSYLAGRQLVSRDPKLAAPVLARACPLAGEMPEIPLDPTFTKECRRILGESAFLAGDRSVATAAFRWLDENGDHLADRLRAQDFLQRIAWKDSR